MTYLSLKCTAAGIVLATSLIAGLASLRIATQYQRFLAVGDAFANGIFLGIAIFHLFPHAVHGLSNSSTWLSYGVVSGLMLMSFFILLLLDQLVNRNRFQRNQFSNAALLSMALAVHALIAGLAVGIAESVTLITALLIAIITHKAFEMFALSVSLMRYLRRISMVTLIVLLFALVTPAGILLGAYTDNFYSLATGNIITACFNAVAAGTFIYVGTAHSRQHQHPTGDSFVKYNHFLAMITGLALMGLLAIWL